MTADVLLRQARRARGWSQRALAARAGLKQPAIAAVETGTREPSVATLDRLLAPTGYRLTALPVRRPTVAEGADAVREALRGGRERTAFRRLLQINDDLRAEHGALRVVLSVAPPAPTGSPHHDAFIAALAEHYLEAEHLPLPAWTSTPDRTLGEPWFVVDLPAFRADAEATSPPAFVRHGIYVNASELDSE
jgi:transcriptional regulator with XRE-family HTH domain